MTCRRSDIVDVAHSGVYHCISRCVRRESLLSLPRRRAWLLSRLGVLTHAAAIDVIAFSAMENHLHLLLRTHPEVVARWSDREVALRKSLLLGTKTKNRKKKAKSKSEVLVETPVDTPREAAARLEMQISMILSSPERVRRARADLSSLGFFHKLLKEPCARMWNREDEVVGGFWAPRFKSPKVLDQRAIETVAGYIELNEVYACAARSLQSSGWSSGSLQWSRLCEAILHACKTAIHANLDPREQLLQLRWEPAFPCNMGSLEGAGESESEVQAHPQTQAQPVTESLENIAQPSLLAHMHRVDQTGRRQRPDKSGHITTSEPSAVNAAITRGFAIFSRESPFVRRALERVAQWWETTSESLTAEMGGMSLDEVAWNSLRKGHGSCYGSAASVALEVARRGQRWMVPVWSSA